MKHVIFTFGMLVAFAFNAAALDRTGWTATVSPNLDKGGWTPNMFDGNVDTDWNSLNIQTAGDWMIIDMQTEQTFNQIIFDQTGATGDYPEACAVYVSNDPDNFGDAVATGRGVNAVESKIDLFAEQTGQYIKIELTADKGGYWVVKELYVNLVTEKDDRFGWTMTASHNNDRAAWALDGDLSTRWESGPQNGVEWIILDMKTAHEFNTILLNQNDGGDYPREYAVYVSDDASDFGEPVASGTGTDKITRIELAVDQTVRYIKIAQTGTSGGIYWSINELDVENNERVSIPQVKNENGKLYYAQGQLMLEGISSTATINIYTVAGQRLKTAFGNQNTVNVNLAQGVYIVNVKDGASSYCEKIVVK
ncbi:hypothetical protein FACS189440_02960 [Bacteroidia bacterium]|nr:hypothetical protein FACS189440_02960 [Bacteroidia bacterium]